MTSMPSQQPQLSPIEWQAVTVALRDAERCGCAGPARASGRIARVWRWLTGLEAPRPLADPRLDTIRRFVCAARRRGERAREMVPELLGFGFTADQVEALRRVAA
ncbi:hypothetical protein [Sphingomonas morindae]|uniref:Regulatory protein RecX n=1 Tax=Sphingomonas morindae TaxID=1541170 RepID=A0ABY4X6A0_9SPHN|nr:hypothetical protein [Sphingomonas morindae]USI72424.1 hypothetical protein LHA26_14160 [Sphingomonas morindae]